MKIGSSRWVAWNPWDLLRMFDQDSLSGKTCCCCCLSSAHCLWLVFTTSPYSSSYIMHALRIARHISFIYVEYGDMVYHLPSRILLIQSNVASLRNKALLRGWEPPFSLHKDFLTLISSIGWWGLWFSFVRNVALFHPMLPFHKIITCCHITFHAIDSTISCFMLT